MFKNVTLAGWATSLFLLVLPFIYSRGLFFAGVNAKYFFILVCVYIIAILFAYKLWYGEVNLGFIKKPIFWGICGLVVVYYLASWIGIYPEVSFWAQILRSTGTFFFTHIALLAVMLGALLKPADWILVRRTIIGTSVLFSFLYFLGSQGLQIGGRFLSIDFTMNGLTLGNETFAGAYVVLALVFTLVEFMQSNTRKTRALFGFFAGLQLLNPLLFNFKFWLGQINPITDPLALFGSAKASSIVAWGIFGYLAIYWIISKLKDVKIKKYGLWGYNMVWIVGIITMLGLLFTSGSFVQEKYTEISSGARIIVWESTESAIAERPILGYGPETYYVAIQKHFDNRLHLEENIGEIWFDRAHNYFLDTIMSIGYLGLAATLLVFGLTFWTFRRAFLDQRISKREFIAMSVFIVAYIIQLQTSFETVTTYVVWAVFVGYALSLANDEKNQGTIIHNENKKKTSQVPSNHEIIIRRSLVGLLVLGIILGSSQLLFKESRRQHALVDIFRTKPEAFDTREVLINTVMARISDFESLRTGSSSFAKGVLERMAQGSLDQVFVTKLLAEANLYEKYYLEYIADVPDDYRAKMNLSYLYFLKTFLGDPSLDKARDLAVSSYALSPESPVPYTIEALSYLYEGNFKQARIIAQKGIDMNPGIEFSHLVLSHINEQVKTFPEISFLKLENL